jgi:hypothetical protein
VTLRSSVANAKEFAPLAPNDGYSALRRRTHLQ